MRTEQAAWMHPWTPTIRTSFSHHFVSDEIVQVRHRGCKCFPRFELLLLFCSSLSKLNFPLKFSEIHSLSAIHNNRIWHRRGAATMAPTRHKESNYWRHMEIRQTKSIWALCQASRLTMWVLLCIKSLNRKSSLKSRKSFDKILKAKLLFPVSP